MVQIMGFIPGSKKNPTKRLEPGSKAPNLRLIIISKRKEAENVRRDEKEVDK
jgi:hypothetical protein